ncbi:discoidin domain-containing protein [Priestia megaterium]|uniref:discoidin domain-containing protein n=1 Tax=Priestia megaterium TaxID=1404 RepID=UPI000BFD6A59|nr:discoidin domain-containing protein [Priestia megaterium]PGO60703.1 hypothetical protein CN981_09130 [Priestia megaterium]
MYYNVLLGKTATASSTWSTYVASNAVDGSKRFVDLNTTRWVSASSKAGEWLQVDIGSMAKIDRFVLYTGNNSSDGYTTDNAIRNGDMQINQSGQWITVASFRDNPANNQKIVMDLDNTVVTDKVRLYLPIAEQQYRVFEIEAYGEILSKNKKEYPNKNLVLPFEKWEVYDNSDIKITELTNRRIAFELNATKQYQGIGMPIDNNFIRTVAGKNVTFSAGKYNKFTYNAQIHLRFSGSASGNIDLVLGNNITSTKFIPADVTSAFLHIQGNEVGFSKYEVEDLQLEVGSVQTAYEPYKETEKLAVKTSKNLLPSLKSGNWIVASGQIKGEIKGDYEYYMTNENNYVMGYDYPITLTQGKTYTISGTTIGDNARIRVIRKDNPSSFLANVVASAPVSFTASTPDVIVRIENNGKAGTYTVKDFYLVEGNATTFEPYKGLSTVATKAIKKNCLPPLNQWEKRDGNAVIISDYEGVINPVSNYTGFRYAKLDLKRGVQYTLSIEEMTDGAVIFVAYRDATDVVRYSTVTAQGISKGVTIPETAKEYWVEMHFQTSRGVARFKNFMLEEGANKSPFEPYKLVNKLSKGHEYKAKKNLLNPRAWVSGRIYDTAFKPISGIKVDGNDVTIISSTNAMTSQLVNVEPFKNYTIYSDDSLNGRGIYVYSQTGTDLYPSSKLSPITFNSGSNTKVIVGLYKSSSVNDLPEIKFTNPMMVEGSQILDFESYQEVVQESSGYVKKMPNKNYPFNVVRESVDVLDGVLYGVNQPRLRNGGIQIDEATTNLLGSGTDLTNWTGQFNGRVEVVKEGYKLYKTTDNISRIAWSKIPASGGKQYTFTVWAKAGTSNKMQIELSDPTVINTHTLTDEFRPYSVTNTVNKTGNIYAYIYGAIKDSGNVGDIIIQKAQVEERGYATTYTDSSRKADKITIPNTNGYIDSTAGSIYIKYSYEDLENAKLSSGFIFDSSASARWFANYDVGNQRIQCVINGLALIQFTPDKMKKDNEMLIQWNQKTMTVTYNGNVSTYTNQTTGASAPIGTISLGARFSLDNAWLGGTMHEFVIKDRNGNTTYRI